MGRVWTFEFVSWYCMHGMAVLIVVMDCNCCCCSALCIHCFMVLVGMKQVCVPVGGC